MIVLSIKIFFDRQKNNKKGEKHMRKELEMGFDIALAEALKTSFLHKVDMFVDFDTDFQEFLTKNKKTQRTIFEVNFKENFSDNGLSEDEFLGSLENWETWARKNWDQSTFDEILGDAVGRLEEVRKREALSLLYSAADLYDFCNLKRRLDNPYGLGAKFIEEYKFDGEGSVMIFDACIDFLKEKYQESEDEYEDL